MRAARHYLRGLAADRRGSAAVEAALALPILFTMCFGVIEVGRGMWMQNSLMDAVDAAARCGAVSASCTTSAQIATHAVGQIKGFSVASSNFTVTTEACGIKVAASVPFKLKIPAITTSNFNLTAQSCRPYTP
ncbi:MAG: TadE/TadG family type IV pilus assembly protein [Novosphingobium sp.]|uniref:TadE/TadG family type IV pilus assembly protein n=1 Tax=Novosphingobium sp. TaxID=1874826 RepID=UPI0032BDCE7C